MTTSTSPGDTPVDSIAVANVFANNTVADELAGMVEDGALLALAPDYSGCAMSVVIALIRRHAKGLHLVGVPQLGLQGDLLIGAGCVESVNAAAVTLGEFGQAPCFVRAVSAGDISMRDSTCPVIHAGLQAAEKNIPFMPLRGVIGSDLVKHRDDWQIIDNPLSDSPDPILLVPEIKPEVALFHAPKADSSGNVWIGVRRELMLMAHASSRCIVTVEEIVDGNLLDDPVTAAGTIPSLYVSEVRTIKHGAFPVGLFSSYAEDTSSLKAYVQAARDVGQFSDYVSNVINSGAWTNS